MEMGEWTGAPWARTEGCSPRGGARRRWRRAGLLAVGAIVATVSCTPPPGQVRGLGLEEFNNCQQALRYLQDAALARVGPYGLSTYGPIWMPPPTVPRTGTRTVPSSWPGGPTSTTWPRSTTTSPPMTTPPAPVPPGSGAGAPDHSGTNVQEQGVDEPDFVKNDGKRLLVVMANKLHIVDLTSAAPRVVSSITLPGSGPTLLVQGDHVLVMSSETAYLPTPVGTPTPPPGPSTTPPSWPSSTGFVPRTTFAMTTWRGGAPVPPVYRPTVPRTRLTLLDLADPAKPVERQSVVVDGRFVDARLVGGRARVVTSAGAPQLPFVNPTDYTEAGLLAAQRANEDVIRSTTISDWLPKVRNPGDDASARELLACNRLSRPTEFSGFETVAVLSLDLTRDGLDVGDTVGISATAQTVYASTQNLYVGTRVQALSPSDGRVPDGRTTTVPTTVPVQPRTALHAFGVGTAGPATYRASGSVDGTLLNQWSLSEHAGHLRVVTTIGPCPGCTGSETQLSVMRLPAATTPAGRRAELTLVGSVGGMGKGEQVKAVRFMGDRAYIVTFRQVDPFYVVDLADPAKPVVAGELKVPGYSAYLHPVGDHQVLGVGRDATPDGRVTGTKVSLYDVADSSQPTEVGSIVLPNAYTSVESTAKAFLWWAPEKLAVVPVYSYGGIVRPDGTYEPGFVGAIAVNVAPGSLAERGRVTNEPGTYGGAEIQRSAVAGDRLLTVSSTGFRVSDLASLKSRNWVPFPTL
jgi:hypothetical protein